MISIGKYRKKKCANKFQFKCFWVCVRRACFAAPWVFFCQHSDNSRFPFCLWDSNVSWFQRKNVYLSACKRKSDAATIFFVPSNFFVNPKVISITFKLISVCCLFGIFSLILRNIFEQSWFEHRIYANTMTKERQEEWENSKPYETSKEKRSNENESTYFAYFCDGDAIKWFMRSKREWVKQRMK